MRRKISYSLMLAVLAAGALFAEAADKKEKVRKIVQLYECPLCRQEAQFVEDSPQQHFCTGNDDRPHLRVAMAHKGQIKPK